MIDDPELFEKTAHKLFGVNCGVLCSKELQKGSIMCPCETANGQHICGSLCEQTGRDAFPNSVQSGRDPLGS